MAEMPFAGEEFLDPEVLPHLATLRQQLGDIQPSAPSQPSSGAVPSVGGFGGAQPTAQASFGTAESIETMHSSERMKKTYPVGIAFAGSVVYDAGGEGDCGPRCIAAFLRMRGVQVTQEQVRRSVGESQGWSEQQINDDVAAHRWWTDQDLQAAANCYDVSIHVHNPRDPQFQRFTIIEPYHPKPNRPTILLHHPTDHYQLCLPRDQPSPPNSNRIGEFDRISLPVGNVTSEGSAPTSVQPTQPAQPKSQKPQNAMTEIFLAGEEFLDPDVRNHLATLRNQLAKLSHEKRIEDLDKQRKILLAALGHEEAKVVDRALLKAVGLLYHSHVLAARNLGIHVELGDGNCFYRAVARQVNRSWQQIKSGALEYLQEQANNNPKGLIEWPNALGELKGTLEDSLRFLSRCGVVADTSSSLTSSSLEMLMEELEKKWQNRSQTSPQNTQSINVPPSLEQEYNNSKVLWQREQWVRILVAKYIEEQQRDGEYAAELTIAATARWLQRLIEVISAEPPHEDYGIEPEGTPVGNPIRLLWWPRQFAEHFDSVDLVDTAAWDSRGLEEVKDVIDEEHLEKRPASSSLSPEAKRHRSGTLLSGTSEITPPLSNKRGPIHGHGRVLKKQKPLPLPNQRGDLPNQNSSPPQAVIGSSPEGLSPVEAVAKKGWPKLDIPPPQGTAAQRGSFIVNDDVIIPSAEDLSLPVVEFLRQKLALRGTKVACGQGGCGACTVLVKFNHSKDFEPVAGCLLLVGKLVGPEPARLLTVEYLSKQPEFLKLAETIVKNNGTQCGFCTPGIFTKASGYACKDHENQTPQDIEDILDGNLCRCTGYRPILFGLKTFFLPKEEFADEHAGTPECVWDKNFYAVGLKSNKNVVNYPDVVPMAAPSSPPPPLELKWHYPRDEDAVVAQLEQEQDPKKRPMIIAGGVGHVFDLKFGESPVSVGGISVEPSISKAAVLLGPGVTIASVVEYCQTEFPELSRSFSMIGNTQVRNLGTVIGNLVASRQLRSSDQPRPSDVLLVCCALEASLTFFEGSTPKNSPVWNWWQLEDSAQFVSKLRLPRHKLWYDRVAVRSDNFPAFLALACVPGKGKIWFNGLSKNGRPTDFEVTWPEPNADEFGLALKEHLKTQDSSFGVFFLSALGLFRRMRESTEILLGPKTLLAERKLQLHSASQHFYKQTAASLPLGEPWIAPQAFNLPTGKACFTHDVNTPDRTLHGTYLLAPIASGTFDVAALARLAVSLPSNSKTWLLTADSIPPKQNLLWEPNEFILAPGRVHFYGQPVALLLSESQTESRRLASNLEKDKEKFHRLFQWEEPLLFPNGTLMKSISLRREPEQELPKSKHPSIHRTTGDQVAPSQAHFYMETQAALVVPSGSGRYDVTASTQSTRLLQQRLAEVLDVPQSHVVVRAERLGGGYGGKEPQSLPTAAAAAAASRATGRPVMIVMDRERDMKMFGKRHSFIGCYDLDIDVDTLKILRMNLQLWSDAGASKATSASVMELAVYSSDNAYFIPDFHAIGSPILTNKTTGTAMRSYGVIQALAITEGALEQAAFELNVEPEAVREANFYQKGQRTPFGQELLQADFLHELWTSLKKTFDSQKEEIANFNKSHDLRQRGVSMMPLRYGVSFTKTSMNQGGARINVYSPDGSVLVFHGGVEMGQGINAKIQQIAASALGISIDRVTIGPLSTDHIPNAMDTGASTGADINGPAVRKACESLRDRIKNYIEERSPAVEWLAQYRDSGGWFSPRTEHQEGHDIWPGIVRWLCEERFPLLDQGFHCPAADGGRPLSKTDMFYYYNYAAACTVVELDVLTGEVDVLRTDILYDAGRSTNASIDIGQVEGGFVQGLGNLLTEELSYPEGKLTQTGVQKYAIPSHRTTPRKFNVKLFHPDGRPPRLRVDHREAANGQELPEETSRSKTSGEPPLVLALTALFATQKAVQSARGKISGSPGKTFSPLKPPMTPVRVLEAIYKI